jgi:hypothetical protein
MDNVRYVILFWKQLHDLLNSYYWGAITWNMLKVMQRLVFCCYLYIPCVLSCELHSYRLLFWKPREMGRSYYTQCTYYTVVIGGVMTSVLANGPKFYGFSPGICRWILRAIKVRNTAFSGGKYNRLPHVVRVYCMVNIPSKYEKRYFVRPNS